MGANFWVRVWVFLFLGYTILGRTFAYLGFPGRKFGLFIGEIVLLMFALLRPNRIWRLWLAWLLGRGRWTLGIIIWVFSLFLFYGLFQAVRGWLLLNHDLAVVLRNMVFNIYPLYLFLGFWVGQLRPDLLRRVVWWLAWVNGIYGTLYILFLNWLDISLPWAPEVPLFGQPGGSALALLGLLVLKPQLARAWLLLLLNTFVLFGVQVRGEWLAFSVGLVLWAIFNFKLLRLVRWIFVILLFFVLMYILDLRIPAPILRGGEISIKGIVARVLAPFNPEVAAELIGNEAYSLAGTITGWRVPWWQVIWNEVHQGNLAVALFGFGYGYPLYALTPFVPEDVKTPHNVFFYALGYSGWLGVVLFFGFQFLLGYALYKSAVRSHNFLGLILWAGMMSSALVGNFFETPFGAIPFYLLMGYSLASLSLNKGNAYANSCVTYLLSAERR